MSDQDAKSTREREYLRERRSIAHRAVARFVAGVDEAGAIEKPWRQLTQIAGQRLPRAVSEQVKRRARTARARLDRLAEHANAALIVDIAEAVRLRDDRLHRFFVEEFYRLPKDDAEDEAGADRAAAEDRERQPERGRAKQLSESRHESCTPLRARCAKAAPRSPCRSWRAAARHGRRSRWSGDRNDSPRHAREAWCA